MLSLTRRIGERIVLSIAGRPDIVIEVKDVYHGRAVLGIDATRDVLILREELLAPEHGEVVP